MVKEKERERALATRWTRWGLEKLIRRGRGGGGSLISLSISTCTLPPSLPATYTKVSCLFPFVPPCDKKPLVARPRWVRTRGDGRLRLDASLSLRPLAPCIPSFFSLPLRGPLFRFRLARSFPL